MLCTGLIFSGTACKQDIGDSAKGGTNPDATILTMEQSQNGKWVILDNKKRILYDVFIYDNGPDYPADGFIRIIKNDKIGYADAVTYIIVIEPQFDCAYPFENGKAKVSNQCQTIKDGEYSIWKSDSWQYIDKQGKLYTLTK